MNMDRTAVDRRGSVVPQEQLQFVAADADISQDAALDEIVRHNVENRPHDHWTHLKTDSGETSYYIDLKHPDAHSDAPAADEAFVGFLVVTKKVSAVGSERFISRFILQQSHHTPADGMITEGNTPARWSSAGSHSKEMFEKLDNREEAILRAERAVNLSDPLNWTVESGMDPHTKLRYDSVVIPGSRGSSITLKREERPGSTRKQPLFTDSMIEHGEDGSITEYESSRVEDLLFSAIHDQELSSAFESISGLGSPVVWANTTVMIDGEEHPFWKAEFTKPYGGAKRVFIPQHPDTDWGGPVPVVLEDGPIRYATENWKLLEQGVRWSKEVAEYRGTPAGKIAGYLQDLMVEQEPRIEKRQRPAISGGKQVPATLYTLHFDRCVFLIAQVEYPTRRSSVLRLIHDETGYMQELKDKPFPGKDASLFFSDVEQIYKAQKDREH